MLKLYLSITNKVNCENDIRTNTEKRWKSAHLQRLPTLKACPPWKSAHLESLPTLKICPPWKSSLPTLKACPFWKSNHIESLPTLKVCPPWMSAHLESLPTLKVCTSILVPLPFLLQTSSGTASPRLPNIVSVTDISPQYLHFKTYIPVKGSCTRTYKTCQR